MKKNLNHLLKTVTAVCLLIMISMSATAQVGKKLTKKKKVDFMAGKVKPIITSPVAGSTIDGPFVMVGKAEPNTSINLYVTPIYKLPGNNTGKPILVVSTPNHKRQHFSVKANDKGIWQSPLIEVMFDSKTTDRRVFAFVDQIWGDDRYESKNTEYLASPKLIMIMETIKIPLKPKEEEKSSGQPETDEPLIKGGTEMPFKISSPTANKNVGHDEFGIAGIGPVGANVRVEVRYSGYRSKSNITIGNFGPIFYPGVDKTTTTVNDELWAVYNVKSNGIWGTGNIEFIKKINGYSCWANTYTITASLVNENGKLVRSVKVNVSRMKTKAIKSR